MYAQFILFGIYYKSDVCKDLLRQTVFKLCNFVWDFCNSKRGTV